MIVAIDIGNTETTVGLFEGREPQRTWRTSTEKRRTGDELAVLLRALLSEMEPTLPEPTRAITASVVPALDRAWGEALGKLGLESRAIDTTTKLPIQLDVDVPASVGADRLVNTLATSQLYERNTIVVDLGTATTFDCITANGTFIGGVIAPGPRAGIERLAQQASQLPTADIRCPQRVIGRRTVECLDSGVFYSIVDGIDGIVDRILSEWQPESPLVLATGGLSELIAPHCRTVERSEPLLTLLGLAVADEWLSQQA